MGLLMVLAIFVLLPLKCSTQQPSVEGCTLTDELEGNVQQGTA